MEESETPKNSSDEQREGNEPIIYAVGVSCRCNGGAEHGGISPSTWPAFSMQTSELERQLPARCAVASRESRSY